MTSIGWHQHHANADRQRLRSTKTTTTLDQKHQQWRSTSKAKNDDDDDYINTTWWKWWLTMVTTPNMMEMIIDDGDDANKQRSTSKNRQKWQTMCYHQWRWERWQQTKRTAVILNDDYDEDKQTWDLNLRNPQLSWLPFDAIKADTDAASQRSWAWERRATTTAMNDERRWQGSANKDVDDGDEQ